MIVEVDAADKSKSVYVVKIYKPSLTDVSLRSVTVSEGLLVPSFEKSEKNYVLLIPPNVDKVTISLQPINTKASLSLKNDQEQFNPLHSGDTVFKWIVSSADAKNTVHETYTITVRKYNSHLRLFPHDGQIHDTNLMCKFCKLRMFCPRSMVNTEQNTKEAFGYCFSCFQILLDCSSSHSGGFQKAELQDPFPFEGNQLFLLNESNDCLETSIDSQPVTCPFKSFGCTLNTLTVQHAVSHISTCTFRPQPNNLEKFTCPECGKQAFAIEKSLHPSICRSKINIPQSSLLSKPGQWESGLIDTKSYKFTTEQALSKIQHLLFETYSKNLKEWRVKCAENNGVYETVPDTSILNDAAKILASTIW